MFAQPIKKHVTCFVSAAMVLTLVGVCIAPLAFAGMPMNTIDPVAIVTTTARHLIVTGPIACTESQTADLAYGDAAYNGGRGRGPHPLHLHRRHPALGSPCLDPRQ